MTAAAAALAIWLSTAQATGSRTRSRPQTDGVGGSHVSTLPDLPISDGGCASATTLTCDVDETETRRVLRRISMRLR